MAGASGSRGRRERVILMTRQKELLTKILCAILASLFSLVGHAATRTRTQQAIENVGVVADEEPGGTLATFRTYFVDSDTIYMKAETLQGALERRPEFAAWGLQATSDRRKADVIIEVTLPFLTWEWNYKIKQGTSSTVLAAGKVKALTEGIAAPQLAAEMAGRIKVVRALPQTHKEFAGSLKPDGESGPALPNKEWKVEFVSGPPNMKPGRGTLTTSQEKMVCRTRDGASVTILAKDVVAVEHVSEKNHMGWADLWDLANPKSEVFGQTLGESAIFLPGALVAGVFVEAWPAEQFVKVDWKENDVLQNVVLKASDSKALLKEMSIIRQETEIDISAEARLVREALANPDRQSWLITIDQPVWVGWKVLSVGTYEVVCIPRQNNFGAVYFFSAKQDSKPAGAGERKTVPEAHALVQVETRVGGSDSASESAGFANARYTKENGMARFSEISKGDRVWLFTLAPLRLEPVPEHED